MNARNLEFEEFARVSFASDIMDYEEVSAPQGSRCSDINEWSIVYSVMQNGELIISDADPNSCTNRVISPYVGPGGLLYSTPYRTTPQGGWVRISVSILDGATQAAYGFTFEVHHWVLSRKLVGETVWSIVGDGNSDSDGPRTVTDGKVVLEILNDSPDYEFVESENYVFSVFNAPVSGAAIFSSN